MYPKRYHSAAIFLHWVMAFAFLGMLTSGILMTDFIEDKSLKFQVYQWHKSLGILLLISFFIRLAIRFTTQKPELPIAMKPLEKKAAKAGHFLLYVWMIALPITGWLVVSSSPYGLPTIVFGWFEWPHIPGVAANETINEFAEEVHGLLAYLFIGLIAVHIGAVIKHYWFDHENLLPRMGIGKPK